MVAMAVLLGLWASGAVAQIDEGELEEPTTTEPIAPPFFITDLIDITDLTPEKVAEMREDGAGWGEILIATRLAERMAAASDDPEYLFDDALADVLVARQEGMGFGEIAQANGFTVGDLMRQNQRGPAAEGRSRRGAGDQTEATASDVSEMDESNGAPQNMEPPFFIADLGLTDVEIEQMRADGAGWGEILIATRLAERIAADRADPEDPEFDFDAAFAEALAGVLDERAAGKGFGEIAQENDLRVGDVMRQGHPGAGVAAGQARRTGEGVEARNAAQAKEKKQGFFARLGNAFGFGKADRPEPPGAARSLQARERVERTERPDRPDRPDRPEKVEKPERPERPDRPERPEKPEVAKGRPW